MKPATKKNLLIETYVKMLEMTKFAENHVGGAIINIFIHLKRNIDIVK